ncbi:MAG: 2-C-methyl-D-erythritol 2,4-cyclodiphosphatesynthase, partial [Chlamydiia bacterium]|nr:2-C-methyl-D-erythritol 2,4-cyclodiphosphatesynthase [Chlamydiia bacterium]
MKQELPIIKTAIGQSKHRFLPLESNKPCIIAGLTFDDTPGFQSTSDGDVVFYALCHALSQLTHIQIIGGIADDLYNREGITDSEVYLKEALKELHKQTIMHVSISLEAKKPLFKDSFYKMRENIARILKLSIDQVGITASSADGLTDCGCGA